MTDDKAVEALKEDLLNLVAQWEEHGIDPDDFVRCGTCHEYFIDENGRDILCACERKDEEPKISS